MFDRLLGSYYLDDSNKWSNIGSQTPLFERLLESFHRYTLFGALVKEKD